jgi:phage terminase large subunit-like protein
LQCPNKPKRKTSSARSPRKVKSSGPTEVAVPFTYAAVANQYARDVIAGRVLACKWVRLACQRHVDDLARAEWSAFAFRFDEDKANRVCRFIEQLPHTKGDWALSNGGRDNRIHLEPWQCFILCSTFGWLHRESGYRRFRVVYVCVPRKNGKSIIGGGIGNYMFAADGEFGAEIYSGATSEKQAWEVFRPAKQMVERTPRLKEVFGIQVNAKGMVILENGSRFEPVIGKPGDGASPSCAIVDEYHEHDSDALVDAMRTGMGARKQPILLVITTAGSNTAGPCHALQVDVEKVLEGSLQRDELFGITYTVDAEDDWTSEEALRKANPNYDVSVFGDFLKTEQTNAIASSRKQNVFKTKHLNIWVNANVAWMNMQKWNALADPSLSPDEFRGLPCFEAADLSSKLDIAAAVRVFKKRIAGADHFYVFGRYYLPEERASQPEFQHYQSWAHDQYLSTTPGNVIDYGTIMREAIADVRQFIVLEFGYDPWNAQQFAHGIGADTPATMVETPQQVKYLSESMKQVEALVIDGRLHHDGNPVLTWMMSNVVAHEDVKENIYPNKERPENKIDGAVALIMAMSRALANTGKPKSIYSTRGVLTL